MDSRSRVRLLAEFDAVTKKLPLNRLTRRDLCELLSVIYRILARHDERIAETATTAARVLHVVR